MKRRLPRGVKREFAQQAVNLGITSKTVDELMHRFISLEKRRTHKRERREGKKDLNDQLRNL